MHTASFCFALFCGRHLGGNTLCGYALMNCLRRAIATASVRLAAPNLRRMTSRMVSSLQMTFEGVLASVHLI